MKLPPLLDLGAQTVRDYVDAFLCRGVVTLAYQKPPGRPSKLTKTQRKALAALIEAGPEAAGYTTGCWNTVLIQDLILRTSGTRPVGKIASGASAPTSPPD